MYSVTGPDYGTVERIRSVPEYFATHAASPDGLHTMLKGADTRGLSVLMRIDAAGPGIATRSVDPATAARIGIRPAGTLAWSIDSDWVFATTALIDGEPGIARLDPRILEVSGAVASIKAAPDGMAPARIDSRSYLLVVVRSQPQIPAAPDTLRYVDAETLEIDAERRFALTAMDPGLVRVHPVSDELVLLSTPTAWCLFDPAAMQCVHTAPMSLQPRHSIAHSALGYLLVVDHGGNQLLVHDMSLSFVFGVSLGSGNAELAAAEVQVSSSGETAFVLTGTGERGTHYRPQSAGLVVVDLFNRSVVARTSTPDYGPMSLVVVE